MEGTTVFSRTLAVVAISLTGVLVPVSATNVTAQPAISSFRAVPTQVLYTGGIAVLVATVKNASTCTFSGSLNKKLSCQSGVAVVEDKIGPNPSSKSRKWSVKLTAAANTGPTASGSVTISQSGKPTSSTTTTTTPPVPSQSITTCGGPCKFSFPGTDSWGFSTVAMNTVTLSAVCPDPGACTATSSQQIADVNVTFCASATGGTNASAEIPLFDLNLTGGAQAKRDSVTFDSSVQGAFGSYVIVTGNECVAGDIYYDVARGTTWSSLQYQYTQMSNGASKVYTWHSS